MASGIVINGLRLRWRLVSLPVLRLPEHAPEPDADIVVVHVGGGSVDAATRHAAAVHLHVHDVDAVDLVPADLPAEELLDVLRLSNRRLLRTDPIRPAAGAGQAVVLTRALADRAGIGAGPADPVEVRRVFAQAKRYAPRRVDQALAPDLRADPLTAEEHLSVWREQYGRPLGIHLATRVVPAAVAAAVSRATAAGAAAVAAAAAVQPALVTVQTAARPPRRGPVAGAGRLAAAPRRLARAARGRWRPERPAHTDPAFIAEAQAAYAGDLALGVDRFRGPELSDCPICGGTDVRARLRAPDMIQCKPGTFRVDTCGTCGTNFQNPQLTPEGLDFYYRDFYDGAGTADTETMFSSDPRPYRRRSQAIAALAAPRRWLDVGGGHGHFCLVAADDHAATTFELLDQSDAVDEAVARGWVARGHRGLFPKLAPELEEQFDVVSMFHYLEHTVDPLAEVDAAWRVLEPGGHYMIEVPAPDCRPARWLGWAWGPWMQPQHLHLLPMQALVDVLEARGFEVVATERRACAQPFDGTWAAFQVLVRLTPGPNAPWTPPRGRLHRALRVAGLVAGVPLLLAGGVADRLLVAPLVRYDPLLSNAYWVVARKPA
jgi:SAM-dependent methyltransferase